MNKSCLVLVMMILGILSCNSLAQDASPPALPIKVTVSCDKQEYMHGEAGVATVVPLPPKLTATLTATNVSDKPQVLEFRSGQRFDFVIRDAQGNAVKRWSEGMSFMMMIDTVSLAPKEELSFSNALTGGLLLGEIGKPLPPGDYTLEGILTSRPSFSATVPFKIVPTPTKTR
jgi:hypothetical protein